MRTLLHLGCAGALFATGTHLAHALVAALLVVSALARLEDA